MSEPTASTLLRASLAPMLDTVGVSLLAVLGLRAMLGGSYEFDTGAVWAGSLGALACWLDPRVSKNVPWQLPLYIAIALLSASVHRWASVTTSPNSNWLDLITPGLPLVSWAVLVYGASYLLRTPWRMSVFVVLLVTSTSALGAQILFDRATTAFVYERIGSSSIPSVFQWGSLHQTGMVLLLAIPFPLAVALADQSRSRRLAGGVVTATLLLMGYINGSRTGVLAMAVVIAAMGLAVLVRRGSGPVLRKALVATVLVAAGLGLGYLIFSNNSSMPPVKSATGDRGPIWTAAAMMAIDHPWLGVGPGNYRSMMETGEYADRFLPWYPYNRGGLEQAHNMLLQASAELGLTGALVLLLLWRSMIVSCWRAWASNCVPLIALGTGGAIAAYFLRSMADSFMDNLIASDRTRILVALFFGVALALNRLTARREPRPE